MPGPRTLNFQSSLDKPKKKKEGNDMCVLEGAVPRGLVEKDEERQEAGSPTPSPTSWSISL